MNYVVSDSNLISVADAIREKGGTSEELAFPQEWIEAIQNISTSSGKEIKKVSFTHIPETDETTFTFTNPLYPNLPKVVICDLDEEIFQGEEISMNITTAFIIIPCLARGTNSSYNIYHEIIRYANATDPSTGNKRANCQTTTSGNCPGYTDGGRTIRVPGHNATDCRYKTDAPYIVSCYYWEDDLEEWQKPDYLYTIDDMAMGKLQEDIIITSTDIKKYAFYGCNMKTLTLLNATNLKTNTHEGLFQNCQNLTTIHLPKLISVGSTHNVFDGCTKLTTIDAPEFKDLGDYCFSNCTSLVNVVLPKVTSLYRSFVNDTKLQVLDLSIKNEKPSITLAFQGDTVFKTLIIRCEIGVAGLSNINAFNNSPFASGKTGGTLYVPQDLITAYQSATNWSTILNYPNNQILPIEGSIYETQYGDGTLIE